MSYTVTKYKDVFTLTNTDGVNSLDYTINKLTGCYSYEEYQAVATLLITESADLLLKADGEYSIAVTQNAVDTSFTIKYYPELLASIIDEVYLMLCGCDCDCECEECEADCSDHLTTMVKFLTYMSLTYPQYNLSLEKVSETIKCLLDIDISCMLVNEKVTGVSNNASLTKKIIAIYYLALYFVEWIQSADDEEIAYIKTKYKFTSISPCISKLGIDISAVETTITNNMGTLTINSGAYVNLPPDQVGNNTIAVLNRATTVLTLAMFTTNTTPVYNDPEGDPVDALRVDSLPADGVLKLNGVACLINDVIDVADINLNLFTYESPNQDAFDSDSFNFSLRDTGSLQWSS